jgi:ABC-type Fe3+-siderophore transport system permease subunit
MSKILWVILIIAIGIVIFSIFNDDVKEFFIGKKTVYCNPAINKTILGFYPMDANFHVLDVYVDKISCSQVNFWKYFVKIEKLENDKKSYNITGIKVWYIIFAFLLIMAIAYIYLIKRIEKVNKKLS